MIVVFPFEVALYEKAGVDVRFVGHPLTDVVTSELTPAEARRALGLDEDKRTVALLPGSRTGEIAHMLPDMLKATRLLGSRFSDLQFVLPVATTLDPDFVRSFTDREAVPVRIVEGRVYDVLRAADAAVVTSGTATLETGLMTVPMVIIYRISRLTYYVLTKLVRGLAHVGLVNIVANRRLVPELIQDDATPERIAAETALILEDSERQKTIRDGLRELRSQLGDAGASRRAAAIMLGLVGRKSDHGTV